MVTKLREVYRRGRGKGSVTGKSPEEEKQHVRVRSEVVARGRQRRGTDLVADIPKHRHHVPHVGYREDGVEHSPLLTVRLA